MKMKLKVERTMPSHIGESIIDYKELKPCCEMIAKFRGYCTWYEVLTELLQAAEMGNAINTGFTTYRLIVEVGS